MSEKQDRSELAAAHAFLCAEADKVLKFTGMPDPELINECRRCGSNDFYAGTCAVCHAHANYMKGEA